MSARACARTTGRRLTGPTDLRMTARRNNNVNNERLTLTATWTLY